METIILASNNNHKIIEIADILKSKYKVIGLKEAGFDDIIDETGDTFFLNAYKKAYTVFKKLKTPVIADDSGLCVDSLNGAPGVISARFGGSGLNDKDRYELLLKQMENITFREARFVCNIVMIFSEYNYYSVQEECTGLITREPLGANGFGYDPIFYLKEYKQTMAQLDSSIKNTISHRAKALNSLLKIIG